MSAPAPCVAGYFPGIPFRHPGPDPRYRITPERLTIPARKYSPSHTEHIRAGMLRFWAERRAAGQST